MSRKILLIGWDAADWRAITPLLDAGKMPALSRLISKGTMGNIATLQPVLSPMLWSSIATGKRPYKHGIHGFSEPDPVSGGIRPVTNLSRKTKAIWNILNQEGKDTITVGWWPSNPAEPLSKGIMVANDYQRASGSDPEKWPLNEGSIHPSRLEDSLSALRFHPSELSEEDFLAFLPGMRGLSQEELDKVATDPRLQSLAKTIADCTTVHAAATKLIQTESWDLMSVYYDAIDHFGHGFMKYHPPQKAGVSDEDFRLFNYVIEAGYRFHDMMLGTLLEMAGDDTTVILMSDHGFHPDDLRLDSIPREPAGPAAEHRQLGIFVASGPGIKQDHSIFGASLLDICPTLLHLFGLPIGEDMDGKVLTDIYEASPNAVTQIPSWDLVPGDDGMHSPDKQISPEDSQAALQQLAALGYIEDSSDEDLAVAMDRTIRELDYNLAQAYIDGGIFTEAKAILERLYERWPMEHRFGFMLAICYQSLRTPSKLREIIATIIERRTQEAHKAIAEQTELGLDTKEGLEKQQSHIEGLRPKAQKKALAEMRERFAKSRPNLFSLLYLEAWADYSESKYEEALTKLIQLGSDFGARQVALNLQGEIYQKLRKWPESRKAFETSLEIDSEAPGPFLGLARTALAEREFEIAAQHARTSLGILYFQPRAHYILGVARYRQGKIAEAESAFLNCVQQAPLFSAAYQKLAQLAQYFQHDPALTIFYRRQVVASRKRLAELKINKSEVRDSLTAHTSTEKQAIPELSADTRSLSDTPAEEIITIVSGLPRSGTSLMMQVLDAAGVSAFTDGKREADDSNQKGYFEHDLVSAMWRNPDTNWVVGAKGKALKVVAPILSKLPSQWKYRVLFMERPLAEVMESQNAMLTRLGKDTSKGNASKAYVQQVTNAKNWLSKNNIPTLCVDFGELVHSPDAPLQKIADFIGSNDKLDAMRNEISPNLHRVRVGTKTAKTA